MYQVVKRDGAIVEFDISKIAGAVAKAFDAQERAYNQGIVDMIALRVTSDFEEKVENGCITVENIQDSVERVLSEAGYADVAKAYILYRKQREKVRNVGSALLNYKELVENYLGVGDWRCRRVCRYPWRTVHRDRSRHQGAVAVQDDALYLPD